MVPILRYCLPAMGVCRTFPQSLVFSTFDYIGMNIQHLYTLQEALRIKDIILHCFNATLTGKLYGSSMELLCIELGFIPDYYSTYVELVQSLTTPTLIQATMVFLINNKIRLLHPIHISPARHNDKIIMEVLSKLDITTPELRAVNHCRLYLKVCLLSEITTGDGTCITEEAWSGKPTYQQRKEDSWPTYPRPSAASWATWKKWIAKAFLGRGRRLKYSLGV